MRTSGETVEKPDFWHFTCETFVSFYSFEIHLLMTKSVVFVSQFFRRQWQEKDWHLINSMPIIAVLRKEKRWSWGPSYEPSWRRRESLAIVFPKRQGLVNLTLAGFSMIKVIQVALHWSGFLMSWGIKSVLRKCPNPKKRGGEKDGWREEAEKAKGHRKRL